MTSPPAAPTGQFSTDFSLRREALDMRSRTRLGGIYYVLAWLLAWAFSESPAANLLSGVAVAAFFAALLAFRFLHKLPEPETPIALQRWMSRTWALLLFTSLAWGLSYAFIVESPRFQPSRLIGAISTIAFSTAMVNTFPMNRRNVLAAVALMYAPGMAAMVFAWHGQRAVFLTLGFYISYVVLAAGRGYNEYRQHVDTDRELLEQRERYAQLSRTDPLTQLGNRYQFDALFTPLFSMARRQKSPLSLVLFDIDLFKQVNDEHGHAAGDMCLQAFADCVREKFRRDSDVLARLGGEEFAILMPDTPAEDALRLADGFREELAKRRWDWSGRSIGIATSVGVGTLDPAVDREAAAFFQRVDRALYRAKEEGRNRTVLAKVSAAA